MFSGLTSDDADNRKTVLINPTNALTVHHTDANDAESSHIRRKSQVIS